MFDTRKPGSINKHLELKNHKTQLVNGRKKMHNRKYQIEEDIEELSKKINNTQSSLDRMQQTLANRYSQLSKLNIDILRADSENLEISDHAILRYMERIVGIDTEMIKAMMLSPSTLDRYASLGDGIYPSKTPDDEECSIVIKNGVVVTAYKK